MELLDNKYMIIRRVLEEEYIKNYSKDERILKDKDNNTYLLLRSIPADFAVKYLFEGKGREV